jgi:hypothetical protein
MGGGKQNNKRKQNSPLLCCDSAADSTGARAAGRISTGGTLTSVLIQALANMDSLGSKVLDMERRDAGMELNIKC